MALTDKLVCVVGRDPIPAVTHLESGEQLHLTLIVSEGVSCERALEFHLDGPGASLDLAGAWRCSGSENVRLQVIVRSGSARAEFDGLVYVAPGAVKTDAHQQCHSLLLSEGAFCEARPQLEIYADDVQCSHGATTGYLNPEELFYMRSRGIPEDEARAMQVEAFLAPVLNRAL